MKKLIRITSVPLSMEKLLGNQLSYMNEFYEVTAVSSNAKQLKNVADNLGIKHHAVEMTRAITPFKDLKSIYCMYRFFRKTKPDIVHSHTPKAGLVGMIAAYLARVPVRLHTIAGLPLLESHGLKRKILSTVESFTYACCTKVYPNSEELKNIILKEKFCNPSKLKVLANGSSNGIDLSHFDPMTILSEQKTDLKKELLITKDDFVFIFLGRIVKDKGINELVSAFKSMLEETSPERISSKITDTKNGTNAEKMPDVFPVKTPAILASAPVFKTASSLTGLDIRKRLGKVLYNSTSSTIMIGAANPSAALVNISMMLPESTSFQAKKYPNVKLLLVGPLEQKLNPILGITLSEIEKNAQIISVDYVQDVRPYLAISNCLVLPSYREGFPNVILQAGAMGLPSIVTNINGCNEIVEDLNKRFNYTRKK